MMLQAIHTVDVMLWYLGDAQSVTARWGTFTHQMEAEDTATVSLRFSNGALGAILATTCAVTERPVELRIHGERGHIRLVGEAASEWEVPDRPAPLTAGATTGEDLTPTTATWGTSAVGYVRQYADFISAIRDHRAPAVTVEDGAAAVEIVLAAYESSRTGCAVNLSGGAI